MRKRLTLTAALALYLATAIAIAVFAQAQPPAPTTSVVTYGTHAKATLQLPQGVPTHPVNLMLEIMDFETLLTFWAYGSRYQHQTVSFL